MIIPLAACADYVEENGIQYYLNPVSQTAELSYSYLGKNNYSGDIVLPDVIKHDGVDYPVTSIAASAFLDCVKVTSIKLPGNLETIASNAFSGCTNVSSISIPNSVTSIGSNAFYNCKNLKSIILPNSLTTIEKYIFWGCSGLTSLTIPEGVTKISDSAFHRCTSLKTVIFPSTLSSIEGYAFSECTAMRDVYCYAETVPNVDNMAFASRFTLHVPEGSVYSYKRNSAWNFLNIVAIGAPVSKTEAYYFKGVSNDGLVSNNPWGGNDNAFWSHVSGYHYWSDRASAIGAHCNGNDYVYTWSKETYPEVIKKVTVNAGAWSDVSTGLKLNNREVKLKTIGSTAYAGDDSRIQFADYVFENVVTSDNNGHLLLEYVLSGQAYIFIRSITIEYVEGGGCDMSEVPTDNAFYAATSFLCERGVLYGSRDDGKYSVEEPLLRKHLANITFRGLFTLKGREIPSTFVSDQYSAIYKDLKSDAPYYQAAKTLLYLDYGDGITPFDRDRDGFFPDGNESRINILKALMEAFNIKPDTEGTDNPFPNDPGIAELSESSPIRMGYVRRAAKQGIITTENTEFHPFVDCLRGEAFLMLARIIQKIEAGEIADPNPQESDFLDPNYKPKPAEPYAALSNDNTVLTFYYDTKKEERNGKKVGSINAAPSWYNASVTTIVIDPSFANCTTFTSTAYWFYGFSNVTSITGLQYLKTDNVTTMGHMFKFCSSLTSLDLKGLKTDNVTYMGGMFSGCRSLTSLDLSGFNTDNVTNMYGMFENCEKLTSLDLSGFKTDNVTSMSYMFMFCRSLTRLNLSGFKTDNVTRMEYMFYGCSGLTRLDMSGFKTDKVTTMEYMFNDSYRLKTIYVGADWSTASVTSSKNMFAYCYGLVGGAGTTYNVNHINHDYARIDGGTDNPGYFTAKPEGFIDQLDGDLNYDGDVDEADLKLLVSLVMDGNKLADADLNGDGKVDAADVVMLVNIIKSQNK